MRAELESALIAARNLPAEDLPCFLGAVEEVRCTAMARLTAPAALQRPDELLPVEPAAERLGVSVDFLYRNHSRFPFVRRIGRTLRFSSLGIDEYIRRSGALTPRRHSAIVTSVR
jgi:predicted DNA-binding transcriptional regulator AlpA